MCQTTAEHDAQQRRTLLGWPAQRIQLKSDFDAAAERAAHRPQARAVPYRPQARNLRIPIARKQLHERTQRRTIFLQQRLLTQREEGQQLPVRLVPSRNRLSRSPRRESL